MRRSIAAMLLCASLMSGSLGACQRAQPAEVDEEALQAVEMAIEEELNAPGYAILALLRGAAQEAQVGWDALVISPYGEPEPVNWWLQRRGYLELSGAQFATRAAFTLTKPAQDMIAAPDQPWFEVAASGDPAIDCETAAAMAAGGCEVEFEVTPELSAAGRAAIGSPVNPLQPMTVSAVVSLGPEDWEVSNLAVEGATLTDVALSAILGTPDQRQAAARAANDAMNGRLAQLAGETEPVINLEAYAPPNYVDAPPPVAPSQAPDGRQTSPFRPGN